jgi:hypothetical protein
MTLWRDVRFAARLLLNRSFTVVAATALALGLGATLDPVIALRYE